MSLNASLARLNDSSVWAGDVSITALRPGQFIQDERWKTGWDLGGRPIRIYCLGTGYLSDIGYTDDARRVYFETTRYGFMQEGWPGEDWSDKRIEALRLGRPVFTDVDQAILAGTDWDSNFQHFLVETFPRIYYLAEVLQLGRSVPIVVGDFAHVREIVGMCFPNNDFLYLPTMSAIAVRRQGFFIAADSKNVGGQSLLLHAALRFLRSHVLGAAGLPDGATTVGAVKAYFGRKLLPGYSGNSRVMTNFNELADRLAQRSYQQRYFDGCTNMQKARLLADVGTAVMPIGANLMNMLFCVNNTRLGIICHPVFQPTDWFVRLYRGVQCPVQDVVFLTDTVLEGTVLHANAPFSVPAGAIDQFLNELN